LNVSSLKLRLNDEQMEADPYGSIPAQKVNECLEANNLVVHAITKVARSFSARNRGVVRNYEYLLPQSVFMDYVKRGSWVSGASTLEEGIQYCNGVLQTFVGVNNFHNFGKKKGRGKKRNPLHRSTPLPTTAAMKKDEGEDLLEQERQEGLHSATAQQQGVQKMDDDEDDEEEGDEDDFDGEGDEDEDEDEEEGKEEEERWSPVDHVFLTNRDEQRKVFSSEAFMTREVTLFSCEPLHVPGHEGYIMFKVQGRSFITHQIRKMIDGTLSAVGGLVPLPALVMALKGPYKFGEDAIHPISIQHNNSQPFI